MKIIFEKYVNRNACEKMKITNVSTYITYVYDTNGNINQHDTSQNRKSGSAGYMINYYNYRNNTGFYTQQLGLFRKFYWNFCVSYDGTFVRLGR